MAQRVAQAYRNRQRQTVPAPGAGGYQNPTPDRRDRRQTQRPRDRPVPKPLPPVNIPEQPAGQFGQSTRAAVQFGRATARAIRVVGKAHPLTRFFDLAQTAYSVVDTLNQRVNAAEVIDLNGGWCIKNQCPTKGGNNSPDRWLGGPGLPCTAAGTVCLQQGGLMKNYPADTNYPTNGAGIVIGRFVSFTGNMRPWLWLAPTSVRLTHPWVGQRPAGYVRPGRVTVRDPWFLPIRQFVATPTRSPTPGYPEGRRSPYAPPERSGGTYGTPREKPIPYVPKDRPQPPGPKEKEKKGAAARAVARIAAAAFAASEWVDAVNAIYDALPKSVRNQLSKQVRDQGRTKGPTPQEKALAIYRNADQIDINQAVLNLIANHVTDAVIGKASANADAFLKGHGVSVYGGGNAF